MPIVKSQQSAALLKEAIVLDLGDLARQAEQIKTAAQAQARQIIAQAQQEAQRMVSSAQGQGFEQGQAQGLAQGLEQGAQQGKEQALTQMGQQLEALQKGWAEALTQFDAQRQVMERQAHQAVLKLALQLAEKITRRKVATDPQVVVTQLAGALEHVLRPADITVHICPEDRPVLEQALPQIMAGFPRFKHVHLRDDPAVGRGGCVLSYGQGRIDATLDVQLQRITEMLLPGESQT